MSHMAQMTSRFQASVGKIKIAGVVSHHMNIWFEVSTRDTVRISATLAQ